MQQAVLVRTERTKTTTRGELYAGGKRFIIIERAWKDNKRNQSCIPVGQYTVKFLPRSASGRYRNCWHVLNVPNRGGILIHNGNIFRHSKGCLILGLRKGTINGEIATLNSRAAMRELARVMDKQDFILTIFNGA